MTFMRPGTQLTRGQRFLHLCIDLARHARQELRDDHATTWAAALTYRTIFGLVPMIVMALIVFRAFGGFAGSQEGLTELVYDYLDMNIDEPQADDAGDLSLELTQEQARTLEAREWINSSTLLSFVSSELFTLDPEVEEALTQRRANLEMRRRIDELVANLAQGATTINIGSIGVFGTLLLIWAAIGLIVTVEKTFNVIYKAPLGRPWHVRIPIYWAIITLGPVLIWGSFYLSTQFIAFAEDVPVISWLVGIAKQFTALLVTWLLFLLLFKLMPNTQVAIRPAMAGAMVSALAWELMKVALRWYVQIAIINPTHARLYGSLALIPILLFWVYMTWVVVLAGLEVTHILQTLPASRMGHFEKLRPAPVARDPWLVIPVMSAIAQAFDAGKTLGVDAIAKELDAAPSTIVTLTDELIDRGLLHRLTDDEGQTFALAKPPAKIRIAELIGAGHEHADTAHLPGHDLLMQLARAQDTALADVTLAGKHNPSPA